MTHRRAVAIAGHTGNTKSARAALSDHDAAVRATALGALERLGELTEPDLVAAFADVAPSVRRRAAAVAATHHWPPLLDLLNDVEAAVVEVAAWAAGERQRSDDGLVDVLCSIAAGHDDALCRESAVAALGAIGDNAGLETILTALSDKAPIRRRAVLALAPFDDPRADAAIASALDDRDWQVRQAAEDLGGQNTGERGIIDQR